MPSRFPDWPFTRPVPDALVPVGRHRSNTSFTSAPTFTAPMSKEKRLKSGRCRYNPWYEIR